MGLEAEGPTGVEDDSKRCRAIGTIGIMTWVVGCYLHVRVIYIKALTYGVWDTSKVLKYRFLTLITAVYILIWVVCGFCLAFGEFAIRNSPQRNGLNDCGKHCVITNIPLGLVVILWISGACDFAIRCVIFGLTLYPLKNKGLRTNKKAGLWRNVIFGSISLTCAVAWGCYVASLSSNSFDTWPVLPIVHSGFWACGISTLLTALCWPPRFYTVLLSSLVGFSRSVEGTIFGTQHRPPGFRSRLPHHNQPSYFMDNSHRRQNTSHIILEITRWEAYSSSGSRRACVRTRVRPRVKQCVIQRDNSDKIEYKPELHSRKPPGQPRL
ncbi:hypothetical protein AAMO2058_000556000 [Amorphochlora amoebiformis]